MRVLLLAPPEPSRPTGGFIFNRQIATELSHTGCFEYRFVNNEYMDIEAAGPSFALLDSLLLGSRVLHKRLSNAGHTVGYLIHALPSQLASGDGARPSEDENWSLRRAEFAVVPSRYMRDHLERWFPNLSVGVVAPGVELASTNTAGEGPPPTWTNEALRRPPVGFRKTAAPARVGNTTVMVTAGTISPVKNQVWLAETLAPHSHVCWQVVGADSEFPRYAAELRRLCTMDAFLPRVERYDPMSRTALFRLLSRADVYLQPSVFESYGMAAAEAVALGVPVVASRVGGLSEAVRDGIDGVLCDRDDSACWNRALDAGAAGELPVPSGGHARTWESAAQALLRFLRML